MKEKLGFEAGPLDIVDGIVADIAKLDTVIANKCIPESLANQYGDMLIEAEKTIPILYQEVHVTGRELKGFVNIIDHNDRSKEGLVEHTTPITEFSTFSGVFLGFALVRGPSTTRAVSMFYTGEIQPLVTSFEDTKATTKKYVCVSDSLMIPVEPVNAHSIELLVRTDAYNIIERSVEDGFDDDQLMDLGDYLNKLLRDPNLTHHEIFQLISYVGSLGLFAGKNIVTPDVVYGSPKTGDDLREYTMSPMDSDLTMSPGNFALFKSHERDAFDPEEIRINDQPSLYIRGKLDNGRNVTAPWSSIVEIC